VKSDAKVRIFCESTKFSAVFYSKKMFLSIFGRLIVLCHCVAKGLTLGNAQINLAFLSLNRLCHCVAKVLTLGNAQINLAFLSLNRLCHCVAKVLTLGNAQINLAFLSLNRTFAE